MELSVPVLFFCKIDGIPDSSFLHIASSLLDVVGVVMVVCQGTPSLVFQELVELFQSQLLAAVKGIL